MELMPLMSPSTLLMEVINGTNAINAINAINVNDNEFRPPRH